MTKQEFIKNEISGTIYIPDDVQQVRIFNSMSNPKLIFGTYVIVNIDKLSEFLAKYIDVKIDK